MGSFLCPCGQGSLAQATGSFQPELTLKVVHSTAQNPSLASRIRTDKHRRRSAHKDRKIFRAENQSRTQYPGVASIAEPKANVGYQQPIKTTERASARPPRWVPVAGELAE